MEVKVSQQIKKLNLVCFTFIFKNRKSFIFTKFRLKDIFTGEKSKATYQMRTKRLDISVIDLKNWKFGRESIFYDGIYYVIHLGPIISFYFDEGL